MPRIGKFIKIEGMLVIASKREERKMRSDCKWVWDFFLENEYVLELDGGDGCTAL